MEEIPITDNHIHVDPYNGEGPVPVAEKFQRAGGNIMIIPNKPTWTVGNSCNLRTAMEMVIRYVNEINQNTDIKAFAVVGPHPAELTRIIKKGMELKEAEKIMMEAMGIAGEMVIEGEAIGIGEVGRPHYEVSADELEIHNRLILGAMEIASDADCAIQLHTESAKAEQFQEFAKMADDAGMEKHRVIKHFSGPFVQKDENYGLTPSLIATRKVVVEGLKKGNNFLMETDYLDDSSRPGAVLGPKTVPRRTIELIRKEILTEEDAYKIHVENVEKIYDINLDF
ncbi:MAG: deoxyribonuclease [Euryarchaeota archaeon]|nr:deoxyribonuclease [Euryarchaeota archaeon]